MLNEEDVKKLKEARLRISYRVIRRQLNEQAGLSHRSQKKNVQPSAIEDLETLSELLKKLGY
jgi:hypothetical protein